MPVDNNIGSEISNGYKQNGVTNFCQTTKPTASAVGDRWYKPSDGTEWYWSGSLWLSKEDVIVGNDYRENAFSVNGTVWGTAFSGRRLSSNRSGVFFNYCTNCYYLTGVTTSTNYWTFSFYINYSDNTTELIATDSNPNKAAD